MNHVIALLFAAFAANSQAGEAQRLEFKGIYPGLRTESLPADWRCENKKTSISDTVCSLTKNPGETIAGVKTKQVFIFAIEYTTDQVVVVFDSKNYLQIKLALTEKYGNGEVSDFEVANRMGGRFANQTVTWRDLSTEMALRKFASKTDEGNLTIRHIDWMQRAKRRIDIEAKNAAGDL